MLVLTQVGADELVQATQTPFWQYGVEPLHVWVAQLLLEQYWRTLLPMQVTAEVLVQATQAPPEQYGYEPVHWVVTQLPALQVR